MTACDLSIIIVSWNVRDLLRACLVSLEHASRPANASDLRGFGPPAEGRQCEVIVVDNASHDGAVAMMADEFPWVRVIVSEENLGFSAGNNRGYAVSRGDFIYFLNPDTELAQDDRDSLWTLYTAVARDDSVGLAGPELRYGDGSLQFSARRFPEPLTAFLESTWLAQSWPANPWARRMHMADWRIDFAHDADWLVGAAMLARRTALEAIRLPGMAGPFDEGFFMYSEELDLCWRLKRAGWRVLYVPQARIVHYEGRSSEQVVAARHIHFNTSRVRLYDRYFGRRWANRLRRYLLLEYRGQLWLERFKRLLGNQPAMRAARIDAYKQVLASRLLPDTMQDQQ
jgi:GT2 family glycosyltransferase